jgi:hypothetical protein
MRKEPRKEGISWEERLPKRHRSSQRSARRNTAPKRRLLHLLPILAKLTPADIAGLDLCEKIAEVVSLLTPVSGERFQRRCASVRLNVRLNA